MEDFEVPTDALGGCRGAMYGLLWTFALLIVIAAGIVVGLLIISWRG